MPRSFTSLRTGPAQSSGLYRDMGKRFGDHAYAAEELVAEIGAAFLCAELGITQDTRADHAQYLAQWLKLLKDDFARDLRGVRQGVGSRRIPEAVLRRGAGSRLTAA